MERLAPPISRPYPFQLNCYDVVCYLGNHKINQIIQQDVHVPKIWVN